MSFVTGPTAVLGAGTVVFLPKASDVGGNNPSFTLYSHMRVPGGTTYTFDNGVAAVVVATTDTIIAIPPGANSVVATGASTVQFGRAK